MATATIEGQAQHVHTALLAILNSLSVAKGAVLPSNMGGKPYITAADVNSEIKRKFVENGLIFLPTERIYEHKEIINNNRIAILISIEGSYTIVSTEDGSSVTIGGVGDGLANGTAVASNIASTNALKNALLRTFLITEQSVEDAAKNGIDESTPNVPKAIQNATGGATKPNVAAAKENPVKELQAQIKAAAGAAGVAYLDYIKGLFPDKSAGELTATDLKKVLKAIQDGEAV